MYSTIPDLLNDIPEKDLIDLVNDEEAEDVDLTAMETESAMRVLKAIADADAEIDGYLRSAYTTPLTAPIDPRVNKLNRIIARYNLTARRNMNVPEGIENQYKMAVKDLEKIQNGTIKLNVTEDSSAQDTGSGIFITDKTQSDRFFNDQFLKDALG